MSTLVDVAFSVRGGVIPLDHGYSVFGAVSRVVPKVHSEAGWGIHPIYGRRSGVGMLTLLPQSALTIRVPPGEIGTLLSLSGQCLDIDGHQMVVGVPKLFPLKPRPLLRSRFVTIKKFEKQPADFAEAVKRQLTELQIDGSATVAVGQRRVIRVGEHKIVGFSVALDGLSADDSIRVQVNGIGGRRHMGAGVFLAGELAQ